MVERKIGGPNLRICKLGPPFLRSTMKGKHFLDFFWFKHPKRTPIDDFWGKNSKNVLPSW